MTIIQPADPTTGLFQITLPEQATDEQRALKKKIDALLETLKQRQSDANTQTLAKNLRTIAEEGFDAPQADPKVAMTKLDALARIVTASTTQGAAVSSLGAFEVNLPDPEKNKGIGWQEIIFELTRYVMPVPSIQTKLRADIETTLTTLKAIFPDKNEEIRPKPMTVFQQRYAACQAELLGIAQTGLETPADPQSARQWLESLQADIVLREGPRIKNSYMMMLGLAAAILATASAVVYLVLRNNPHLSNLLHAYRNLFILLTGTLIGTWLSFGLRRMRMTFKDLAALEDDMMEPAIRLVFTGLIAITIAFIFATGMVNINVGGLNSAHLLTNGSSALLIGLLLGVSEQALPSALTRRASQFVSEIGGKI